jgi:hypothetical protein
LTGAGFSNNKSEVDVRLYKLDKGQQTDEFVYCNVFAATTTEIKCNLLGGPSGEYSLIALIANKGKALYKTPVKLALEIKSVTPASGSVMGGTLLEVRGLGFSLIPNQNQVLISNDENFCMVTEVKSQCQDDATVMCLNCTTPVPKGLDPEKQLDVHILGRIQEQGTGTGKFTYKTAETPTVTACSETSVKAGDSITLTGTKFGTDKTKVSVKIGGVAATVTAAATTTVTVTVPALVAAEKVGITQVNVEGLGDATQTPPVTLDYNVVVTAITPNRGS